MLALYAWLAWISLQVLLLLLSPLFAIGPCTNGLWIRVPARFIGSLMPDELAAVVAHERGHRALLHGFENLLRRCFFMARSRRRAVQQELEADDWAVARGHGAALASALRKLSSSHFDAWRARRLEGST